MTIVLSPAPTRGPRVLDLASFGDRVALHTADGTISYVDLAGRVDDVARRLGATRRLVLVEGTNTVGSLTAYLAALTAGHVVLLAPPGRPAHSLAEAWDPDVVADGTCLRERRQGTRHELHPDLSLLLSTSGSTGSPKLVRLSADNLLANATSIADYLRLTPEDRAITSLPLHYCYGLSVVHSHLLVGASLVLTRQSVVDDCFWELACSVGATSFAGVPHTFELLERSGFAGRRLPSLRYVTQAGGRLAPEQVRRWHQVGAAAGWDLVVMYGQTEATARMAWLPPELAAHRPGSIGIPVPGGALRLDPVEESEDPGVGELVYEGRNVMLGYAEQPADLARGATLTELRTGDLAREVDGLWEVLGRRDRSVKMFGLRLDLDHLERQVAALAEVSCVVVDEVLHAFTTRPRAGWLREELAGAAGLPVGAVRVSVLHELPRTPSGKPDLAELRRHASLLVGDEPAASTVRDDYAVVLGRPDATDADSFVGLGGDSLSYVELATRLSRRLGDLPPDWHTRPLGTLEAPARSRPGTRLDSSVVLRAGAVLAVVGTHANLWTILGGAHLLLVVAGWNLARFQLAPDTRSARVRRGLTSLAQLVVPASVLVGGLALVSGYYGPLPAFYLNGFLGPEEWNHDWQLWFLEAMVWTTLAVLALLAVPALDRLERRAPFGFALALLLAATAFRYAWVGLEAGPTNRYTIGLAGSFVLLGWVASRADTPTRRWAVVVIAAVTTYGFFGDLTREALVAAGAALLVLVPTLRVPRLLVGPLSVMAASSLMVYLTHWQVYPHLEDVFPLGATVASFAVGIGVWRLTRPALRRLGRTLHG